MNAATSIFEPSCESDFFPGQGKAIESVNRTAAEIARTNIPVLILGESGTGKDVYARLLHRLSGSTLELRKMTCAVLEPGELPALLRTKSSDSVNRAGTLFLDGVDELAPACQRALLSIFPDFDEGTEAADYNCRVISSSSRNFEDHVTSGLFRKELYFRLNGVCLRLPSLRERKEDIAPLLDHFLARHAILLKRIIPPIDPETMQALVAYDWPGNIRELENFARKVVALGRSDFAASDLRMGATARLASLKIERTDSLKVAAKAASRQREREMILEALERTKWNRKRAARELQISYKALLYKLKQIGSLETGIQN